MKKLVSALAALAVVVSAGTSALAAAPLSDVEPGAWYYDSVAAMTDAGVIDGYSDGSFRPDGTVTAAEFVTMTARITGGDTGENDGYWAGVQMEYAYGAGWVSEELVPRAEPDTPVTRALACKIVAAALSLSYPAGTVLPFEDSAEVDNALLSSVLAMYANGLIDGFEDNTLRPNETLTRAQAAALLYRAAGGEMGSDYITAAGYTAEQIVDFFCDVALDSEYGSSDNLVIKWASPIRYSVTGAAGEEHLALLKELIDELNTVPGFPGISPAQSVEEANLKIHFVSYAEMTEATGGNFNGYASVWYDGEHMINRGDIYYSTEMDPESFPGVISEELCQSLGLLQDTYDYPESIFYQYHTDAQRPSALDRAVIELLYRPEILPGMDEEAVRAAAAELVR